MRFTDFRVAPIAKQHPETVQRLGEECQAWWISLEDGMQQTVRCCLGGNENPSALSSHDWHQIHIARGDIGNGSWAIDVERSGT